MRHNQRVEASVNSFASWSAWVSAASPLSLDHEKYMKQMQFKRWWVLWPPVADEQDRKGIIKIGYFVAFIYAAWWGLMGLALAVRAIIGHDCGAAYAPLETLIRILIGVGVGWGTLRRSRIAVSAGVVLPLAVFIGHWIANVFMSKHSIQWLYSIQWLTLAWIFANSTRAVFAYHKALVAEKNRPV